MLSPACFFCAVDLSHWPNSVPPTALFVIAGSWLTAGNVQYNLLCLLQQIQGEAEAALGRERVAGRGHGPLPRYGVMVTSFHERPRVAMAAIFRSLARGLDSL
jgi:hypothetical protein